MSLLRRPEIAVLLAVVLAGLVWVAVDQRARHHGHGDASGQDAGAGAGVRELQITRVRVLPDGSHRRMRLDFTARHEASAPVEVRSPHVRLLDSTEAEVPAFFAPGEFPPTLAPGATAASWIEFWLTESQAAGPLTFEVAGRRIRVPGTLPAATGG